MSAVSGARICGLLPGVVVALRVGRVGHVCGGTQQECLSTQNTDLQSDLHNMSLFI